MYYIILKKVNMNNKKVLEKILIGDDVVKSIRNNMQQLIVIIPEISDMVGFEHKHPHHHLDVWEHTLYALSFSPNNFDIRLALLLHDIGKPHSYQDREVRHFEGHPEMSAKISKCILQRLGYDDNYITYICEIIKRHDIPLTENDILANINLSKIIFEVQKCDALAHNPAKNQKRLAYIETKTKLFKEIENINHSVSIK